MIHEKRTQVTVQLFNSSTLTPSYSYHIRRSHLSSKKYGLGRLASQEFTT